MPDKPSLAAQAIANGPMTAAQPSFNGWDWLVIANMGIMTAAALIMLMLVVKIAGDLLRDRGIDSRGPLVTLLRWIALIAFFGMLLRTGVEAITLWGWNPLKPEETGWYNTLKRLVDPFGALAYIGAGCLYFTTEDALFSALERKPFPERLTATLPRLVRPGILAGLALVAAALVVTTR